METMPEGLTMAEQATWNADRIENHRWLLKEISALRAEKTECAADNTRLREAGKAALAALEAATRTHDTCSGCVFCVAWGQMHAALATPAPGTGYVVLTREEATEVVLDALTLVVSSNPRWVDDDGIVHDPFGVYAARDLLRGKVKP